MAYDFTKIMGVGGLAQRVKNALNTIFNTTSGHDHDGTNSKAVVLGTGVVTATQLASNAVEEAKIKAKAVSEGKLADAVVAKLHAAAANVAAIATPAAATAEDCATKINEILTALKATTVITPDA